MVSNTQAGGKVEASHWHDEQDVFASIEDDIEQGAFEMHKSVTIEETTEKYYVMINGKPCGTLSDGTRHESIARRVAEGIRSTKHRIASTSSGFACQWYEPVCDKWWTCSKTHENAHAIYRTRAEACSFFDRNGIVEG
jgi:hypothetical protein